MLKLRYQDVCRFYKKDFWGYLKAFYLNNYRLSKIIFKRVRRNRRFRVSRRRRIKHRLRRKVSFKIERRFKRYKRRLRLRFAAKRKKFVRSRVARRFFKRFFFNNRYELLKLDTRRYVRKKRLPKSIFRFHNKERLRLYFLDMGEHSLRYYLMNLFKSGKNFSTKISHVFEHFGSRLDHLLYLTKFAPTLFHARYFLSNGWIVINNKVVRKFYLVPSPGARITINPTKLKHWYRFRKNRINFLYNRFSKRLKLRVFYAKRIRRLLKKRFRLATFRSPRNRRYNPFRVKRVTKSLIMLSKYYMRETPHYRKKRNRSVRSTFLIFTIMLQLSFAIKRLVYLSHLINNHFLDNEENTASFRALVYNYYIRLKIVFTFYRLYLKLLRRLAKQFRIRLSKRLHPNFLFFPFYKNLRTSQSRNFISNTFRFEPWADLGIIFPESSKKFLFFWKVFESNQYFKKKVRRKVRKISRFSRLRRLPKNNKPKFKKKPHHLKSKFYKLVKVKQKKKFRLYRRVYNFKKRSVRHWREFFGKTRKRRKRRHYSRLFALHYRTKLNFLYSTERFDQIQRRKRKYSFRIFKGQRRYLFSRFWFRKLISKTSLKKPNYVNTKSFRLFAFDFIPKQLKRSNEQLAKWLEFFLTNQKKPVFIRNHFIFSKLFFIANQRLLNKIFNRLAIIQKTRYQLTRRLVFRGFRRFLLRPAKYHYLYENMTKSIFYFGVLSKFRKRYSRLFFFPSKVNIKSFSFFYFSRKNRPVLKRSSYAFFSPFLVDGSNSLKL